MQTYSYNKHQTTEEKKTLCVGGTYHQQEYGVEEKKIFLLYFGCVALQPV